MKVKNTPENPDIWQYHGGWAFLSENSAQNNDLFSTFSGHIIIQCNRRVNFNTGSEKIQTVETILPNDGSLYIHLIVVHEGRDLTDCFQTPRTRYTCRTVNVTCYSIYCMLCWLSEIYVAFKKAKDMSRHLQVSRLRWGQQRQKRHAINFEVCHPRCVSPITRKYYVLYIQSNMP
jgi:hypothetical protein